MFDQELLEILRQRQVGKFAQMDRGDLVISPNLAPCRLKILMVVDSIGGEFLNISFSFSNFGLSATLDTLRTNPEFFVRFDVTRAHRQTDTSKPDPDTQPGAHERYGPHFEKFRFTQPGFNIDDYDQVWLFGIREDPDDAERLTDEELGVLAAWMDRGGGLFAAGDHAQLGASMCSRVPRAATMRKWTREQGVPPAEGPTRHDTLRRGHDSFYDFDDESDDTPMEILLKYYDLASWSPFRRRRAPHSLLCGSTGPIDVLPDHPHEGEVIDEATIDLGRTFGPFAGYGGAEYPSAGGAQPSPEVIAWAQVRPDHTNDSDRNKQAANPKTFGVIGAYDGHPVDRGRVAVDSTWHHWFDVNLTGRLVRYLNTEPQSLENPKTLGFLATPAGRAQYARIQNYFRNTAIWLASKPKQRCMALRAIWGCVLRYPAAERLHPDLPIWELGQVARDVIGQRASQCLVTEWVMDLFPEMDMERFKPQPDPCLTCPPLELVEIYTLGGITREMLKLSRKLEAGGEVAEAVVAEACVEGVRAGTGELMEGMRASMDETQQVMSRLEAILPEVRPMEAFMEGPTQAAE